METIEDKLLRIRKFGMDDSEIIDDQHRIDIMNAHIEFLEKKVAVMETALDFIASDLSTKGDVTEIANRALEWCSLRPWRNNE